LLDLLGHGLEAVNFSPEVSFFLIELVFISIDKVSLLLKHAVVFPQLLIVERQSLPALFNLDSFRLDLP